MPVKYSSEEPEVYLPLEKLDKCAVCKKSDARLMTCGSCAEVIYCSQECQKKDWKSHKADCGQTDRIDFGSYYPFVAAVQYMCHMHRDSTQHPALKHKIVNSPNPGSMDAVVELPNNTSATLVLLGDEIEEMAIASPKWWPTALSPKVRSKLFRRIVNEGLLLPIVYATTLAMVSEIYTTTAVPASEPPHWQFSGRRRVRLQYHKSPIADIGIAKGTCTRVTAQDHLAYYNVNTNEFFMGQDPTDHYWIYLTTLSGKEYFLDCGMFTFNFSMMVDASNHTKYGFPPVEYVPAFFYGRELEKSLPLTGRIGWTPDKKFSILRNSNLRDILRTVDGNYCRTCTDWERKMTMEFFSNGYHFFRLNIQNREYLNFPKEPQVVFELDPDEKINATTAEEAREDKACEKYLRKWTRKLKKGQITTKQWDDAFNAWDTNRHDIVRKLSGLNVEKPKNTPQHGCEYGLKAREG